MYVVGFSYLLTLAVIAYLVFRGPAELSGFTSSFSGDAMAIDSVQDSSLEAKAGLRAGDRVVMIDDRPIRNVRDYTMTTGNSQADRPQRWTVTRGNERLTLEVVPRSEGLRYKWTNEGYNHYLGLLLPGFFIGFLIAWKRPADPVARVGSWFILTASMAFGFPVGWAVPWRMLPAALQLLLWIPQLSRFVLEGIFLSFFMVFPRRLVTRTWIWIVVWAPVLATLPWRVKGFYAVIHPGEVSAVPAWILTAGFLRALVYLFIAVLVLALSYRRLLDLNEKRRVRVVMLGTAISLLSSAGLVWADTFTGRNSGAHYVLLTYLFMPWVCPLSLAYAILRHRILDISVIIRQGLQYAFARGGVIGFAPLMGGLFILDLSINSDERIADIFRMRGWAYAAAAAVSLIAYWNRQRWLEVIDHRFFRERYNAGRLLRDVVGEIRTAGDFEAGARRVVERIETALHPEFVSIMIHPPGESEYRAVATVPVDVLPPRLSAENKVVALLHVLGKPLELLLGDSGWLDERLPQEESEFVRRSRIDLLVPIATGPGRTEAILACGIKRSEEPYTREDEQLLEAIAASLALSLELPAPAVERPAGTFRECPECGNCYELTAATCRIDGEALVAMQTPRVLAGRYRLERRRGKGGMGAVYEATDNTLERRVAVKLIRDDLVDSVDARQRFRREARAAAGFTHPNVVTIYDYGVDGDTRAFLVMELLNGIALRDLLKQHKRLPPSRIVEIFRGVCAAVEAAHQRELIHRDLKPENIFLVKSDSTAPDVVKVLDFGIAKFLPSHDDSAPTRMTAATDTGVLIGTPAYMSPEQLMGQELNVRWDLWALTVVVYEALTGALPFAGSSVGDWSRSILTGNFTPLSVHLNQPPDRWQAFFNGAFTDQRPHSAAEFFTRLEEAFAG